jgi:hypothetical protein
MDPAGIQDEYSERAGARNGEGESKPPWRAVRMGGKLLLDSGGAVGVDGEAVVSRAAFALDAGAVWEIGGKGGGGHGLTSQMARRRDTTSAPLAKLKAWAPGRDQEQRRNFSPWEHSLMSLMSMATPVHSNQKMDSIDRAERGQV